MVEHPLKSGSLPPTCFTSFSIRPRLPKSASSAHRGTQSDPWSRVPEPFTRRCPEIPVVPSGHRGGSAQPEVPEVRLLPSAGELKGFLLGQWQAWRRGLAWLNCWASPFAGPSSTACSLARCREPSDARSLRWPRYFLVHVQPEHLKDEARHPLAR